MARIGRARSRLAMLIAVLPLLLGLATPAQAQAPVPDPSTIHRVSWSALRYEISKHRVVVGPSRYTGYGKLVITGLVLVKGTKNRYHATYKVYDESRSTMGATRTLKGVCWPWNSGTIFGCSSPTDPKSWDWRDLWHKVETKAKDTIPGTPMNYDREKKCIQGAAMAGSYGTVTKMGVGLLFAQKLSQAIPTPASWAIGMVGGCVVKLWW